LPERFSHLIENPRVGGSVPRLATILFILLSFERPLWSKSTVCYRPV